MKWRQRVSLAVLALSIGLVGVPGCGHSEEEWQAKLKENQELMNQLNAEKGVPQEVLIHTLEQAIESAYRRNADAAENVVVKVDSETGQISVFREYEVVATPDEVTDPELQRWLLTPGAIEPIN